MQLNREGSLGEGGIKQNAESAVIDVEDVFFTKFNARQDRGAIGDECSARFTPEFRALRHVHCAEGIFDDVEIFF
jgi:hypothetical protein